MIARIAIPVIVAILLANAYFDWTSWRSKRWWKRLLCWLLPLAAIGCTLQMTFTDDYFPETMYQLTAYVTLLFVYVIPVVLCALCSCLGRLFKKQDVGEFVGALLALLVLVVYVYGSTIGFRKLEVRQVEFANSDLPVAFDGYRIVQVSDLHVGTYTGSREEILRQAVDSINAQHADMVVFTGDIQNMRPQEIEQHMTLLGSIKAADGVFSVLGNHDYAEYVNCSPEQKADNCDKTQALERQMGWILLTNQHRTLHRGADSIVVAGMENDGEGRFPQLGDIPMTLQGVGKDAFIVMLQHDPTAWRRKILPQCHAQLTLSGHTHAAQFELFGWSPVALKYREYDGSYYQGDRAIHVSKGVGGVIPFRFGATGEIVVIKLKKK